MKINKSILTKIFLIGIFAEIIAIILLVAALLLYAKPVFDITNNTDDCITIAVQKAERRAFITGYITLQQGQELEVTTSLTGNSFMQLEIISANGSDVRADEVFIATDARKVQLPPGEYIFRITAKKGTDGSITIHTG